MKVAFKAGVCARDPVAYDVLLVDWRKKLTAAYPPDSLYLAERIDAHDSDAIEQAVIYIEADPWVFRSGYFKDHLLRRLRRATLTEQQRERLREALLAVVDMHDRREFRRYCRLAAAVANDDFRAKLDQRASAANPDRGQRRRANWMLAALPLVPQA